jgi:hypothetical protein
MTANGIDQIAQQQLQYAHDGNWRLLVAMVLSGVIWILRTYLMGPTVQSWRYVGKLAQWFRTDRGGVVLTLSVGVIGGLVTAFQANAPFTVDLFVTGIVNGLLASGFFCTLKKLFGIADPTQSGAVGAGTSSSAANGVPPPASGSLRFAASLGLLLAASTLLSGCACLKPENKNSKGCVVAQHEINCATDDVKAMWPKFMPLIAWLFAGASGPIDSNAIVAALEQTGFKFVGCSAAQLEHDFSTDPAGAETRLKAVLPDRMKAGLTGAGAPASLSLAYHEGYQKWRAKHLDVRFCFQVDGRKVCR